jgi:hydrogenase expression/formation protein HypD
MAAFAARREGLANFSMLVSHVLVPPAMRAILEVPGARIDGFLAAGHVCAIMGVREYEPIARRYRTPIVVTGFEPLDILEGVLMCVRQLEAGRAEVENQYSRSVREDGNQVAQALMREVFKVIPRRWRGVGDIADSGLGLADGYADFDAERRFGSVEPLEEAVGECIAGAVLRGEARPPDCAAFGVRCTPERPLGVTMVSAEGACAAYYRYRRPARLGAAG